YPVQMPVLLLCERACGRVFQAPTQYQCDRSKESSAPCQSIVQRDDFRGQAVDRFELTFLNPGNLQQLARRIDRQRICRLSEIPFLPIAEVFSALRLVDVEKW